MDARNWIGQRVRVVVDRPVGSKHPRAGHEYPVNYGYVPGTTSGDGSELDAYVLGVSVPLAEFEGTCIAVIRRRSESDDKLIVVPAGLALSDDEIRALTRFQEQYFQSEISRSPEESCADC